MFLFWVTFLFERIVHSEIKIAFTRTHVVSNLYDLLSFQNIEEDIVKNDGIQTV